jgi:nitroreductase
MELTEVMRTQYNNYAYTNDPVPDQVLYDAIEVARFGPQGGNRQGVRFLIVRDGDKKTKLAAWYLVAWKEYMKAALGGAVALAARSGDAKATRVESQNVEKGFRVADEFAKNLGERSAIIVVCASLSDLHPTDTDLGRLSIVGGASVYPWVQNMCLALRNVGVATTFTTLLCAYEKDVKSLLKIPEGFATACHIAVGYPASGFPKKLTRRPVEELAFVDTFGRPLSRTPAAGN